MMLEIKLLLVITKASQFDRFRYCSVYIWYEVKVVENETLIEK